MKKKYLELSKMSIGVIIGLGSIYPFDSYWYFGFIIGVVIMGWGWRESMNHLKTGRPIPTHKIGGLILLIVVIVNLIKFFLSI